MVSMLMNRKVLIVDDEAPVRSVLSRYFRRRGFEVLEAGSGLDAIETISQHQPQIVLLDILMPELNGLETLYKLKKLSPASKVIMITGMRDEDVFRWCMDCGAIDYIVKPFELWNLDARILGKLLS